MYEKTLLNGHTIQVTGGGTGLGARVAICGRRTAPLEEIVAAIEAKGGTAAWASLNVMRPKKG
ncbi:MAG: hypothetical protein AAFV53_16030 [Myxococcota bacterium]